MLAPKNKRKAEAYFLTPFSRDFQCHVDEKFNQEVVETANECNDAAVLSYGKDYKIHL